MSKQEELDEINYDNFDQSKENDQVEDEQEQVAYVEEVKVITRGVDFSVRELKSLRDEGELIVPKFQRELVWDKRRKSRFIESILLGYPIPNMFFTDYEDGEMMIIDGQQRIDTLVEFLGNELKIINREDINPKWRSKYFKDLEIDAQKKLKSSNIRAAVFQILSDDESEKNTALYSLFERINTGSIQLNAQEIRRAIFTSSFTQLLNDFVTEDLWVSAYRLVALNEAKEQSKDKRLKDQEVISRYYTLKNLVLDNGPINKDISYKNEINNYLASIKTKPLEEVQQMFKELNESLKWLSDNFELDLGNLFRRPIKEVRNLKELEVELKNKKLNISLFESLLIAIDSIKKDRPDMGNVSFNSESYLKLFLDPEFVEAISSQTNKLTKIRYRINKVKGVFEIE